MGKIRTRVLGDENQEEQQKKDQKEKSAQKKAEKKKDSKALETLKAVEKKDKDETEGEGETLEKVPEKKASSVEEKKAKKKKHVLGKKHKEALKKVNNKRVYTLADSLPVLKKIKYANFDETVELHLNVDEQGLKGEVSLPHSTGKTIRVKIADDKLLENLDNGIIDFDVLVAHPSFMVKLSKYARVLGPKGLMPNPKSGTVSTSPEEVVKKFEKGTLRWKTEPKFPLIHQLIGKISFDEKLLVENAEAFIKAVGKPHIKDAFIKTTMSPALKLDIEKV